jgi:hypothetical protein
MKERMLNPIEYFAPRAHFGLALREALMNDAIDGIRAMRPVRTAGRRRSRWGPFTRLPYRQLNITRQIPFTNGPTLSGALIPSLKCRKYRGEIYADF